VSDRIVVTDHGFHELTHLTAVAKEHGALLDVGQTEDPAEVVEMVRGATVVLNRFAPITREALSGLRPGAVVVRYGIGYDNVDMVAARARGVRVANVPDYGVETVADHAAAMIMCLARKITDYDRAVRTKGWINPTDLAPIKALSESTLGLVGTGRIGLAVAARMAVFGCDLAAHDPYADPNALAARGIRPVNKMSDLLVQADILSLHAPLTERTRGIIDAESLRLMKPTAMLVNTARGPLVDTEALAAALLSGVIAGAAVDVVDPEPLPRSSALWETEAIVTPHAAFYSETSVALLEKLAAEEAGRALAGEPLRCEVMA
jgi:D-3-phosphoglycerate dehydrogenase / 2-oxoglutarate reductase